MQHPNEPLRGYNKWFTVAFTNVNDLNESFAIQAFIVGVINKHVHYALYNSNITIMHELVSRAITLTKAKKNEGESCWSSTIT